MKVTYLGTTMLLFDDNTDRILFDCHITRPSIPAYLFGKFHTDTQTADRVIREYGLKGTRAIFISHAHHDHVMDMPYFANQCSSDVYGSTSALNVARGGDVPEKRLNAFTGGEIYTIGNSTITVLPSVHSKPTAFNNDLGQTIDQPLRQPARGRDYKEGGSFDFLVEHNGKRFLIRPSYNYVPGQLDHINADILFLGIAGLSTDDPDHKQCFWRETAEKVKPRLIIPLHWDNFFTPLYGPVRGMPRAFEDTGKSLHELCTYCATHAIDCTVLPPLSSMEL